jgi:alpha-N-arabinofuranosidase
MPVINPILPGFHPDPSICRVGDDYYLVTSSFEYVPGVPLFHSRDLVHWRQLGFCLTRPSQLPLPSTIPSRGIYAPTLRYHQGTFYLVTTNVDVAGHSAGATGNFYIHTTDPAGAWSDPIWLDQSGIDPSLFFDDDGRAYLTSTFTPPNAFADPTTTQPGWGIQQSEIEIATGRLLTAPHVIWSGTGGAYPEAPHLYKIHGFYYLLIAEGGTEYGHMATIARSASPWGPWEPCPHNPILSHRSQYHPIQATGHADLVEAQDGSWWLVCLGVRPQPGTRLHHLGRETFLAPVIWDQAGWPHVGDGGRIALSLDGPNLPAVRWPTPGPRDDFDGPTLGCDWNFLRWPQTESWSLTTRLGFLRLIGGPARLDDGSGVVFVGRRQAHAHCSATTRLEFAPDAEGQEAGLVVWMNERHHYAIAVTWAQNGRRMIVRQRIGALAVVVAHVPLGAGPVTLQVSVVPPSSAASAGLAPYTFAYACNDDDLQTLAHGDARYLASEVAGGFTGVYVALYATANGAPMMAPADFDWFEYRPQGLHGDEAYSVG